MANASRRFRWSSHSPIAVSRAFTQMLGWLLVVQILAAPGLAHADPPGTDGSTFRNDRSTFSASFTGSGTPGNERFSGAAPRTRSRSRHPPPRGDSSPTSRCAIAARPEATRGSAMAGRSRRLRSGVPSRRAFRPTARMARPTSSRSTARISSPTAPSQTPTAPSQAVTTRASRASSASSRRRMEAGR